MHVEVLRRLAKVAFFFLKVYLLTQKRTEKKIGYQWGKNKTGYNELGKYFTEDQ